MPHLLSITVPAEADHTNEDALIVSEQVVVVVDGAGLPRWMRAGCVHSVQWFAQSIAEAFHRHLTARTSSMADALAEAITKVAASHAQQCDLAAGSPSATVAAWRVVDQRLEYLVLCDASLVILDAMGRTRNRPGGFWVVQDDPSAAQYAVCGDLLLQDLDTVLAVSDGASRAYDLCTVMTPAAFAAHAAEGRLEDIVGIVRAAEDERSDELTRLGMKVHDDLTIVAARFPIDRV